MLRQSFSCSCSSAWKKFSNKHQFRCRIHIIICFICHWIFGCSSHAIMHGPFFVFFLAVKFSKMLSTWQHAIPHNIQFQHWKRIFVLQLVAVHECARSGTCGNALQFAWKQKQSSQRKRHPDDSGIPHNISYQKRILFCSAWVRKEWHMQKMYQKLCENICLAATTNFTIFQFCWVHSDTPSHQAIESPHSLTSPPKIHRCLPRLGLPSPWQCPNGPPRLSNICQDSLAALHWSPTHQVPPFQLGLLLPSCTISIDWVAPAFISSFCCFAGLHLSQLMCYTGLSGTLDSAKNQLMQWVTLALDWVAPSFCGWVASFFCQVVLIFGSLASSAGEKKTDSGVFSHQGGEQTSVCSAVTPQPLPFLTGS